MAEEEQRILLTQAETGMVLSRPVQTPTKLMLCGRGAELSDLLIRKLMARGIKRVWVKGRPLAALAGHEGFAQRMARLRLGFSRVRHLPHMAALEAVIEKQIVRRS